MMTQINIKRVYDGYESSDGYRVLVDKLWPRGEKKDEVHYDYWAKELAPSDSLREWFHEDIDGRWEEFKKKYHKELQDMPATQELIDKIRGQKRVTLLYGSKNKEKNNAVIIEEYLRNQLNK